MTIHKEMQGPLSGTTLGPRSGLEMGTPSSQPYTTHPVPRVNMLELRRFNKSHHIEDEPRDPVMILG